MDAQTLAVLGTVVAALITAFFAYRSANRTAQPSAQAALNAGFQTLITGLQGEVAGLRGEVDDLKGTVREQKIEIDQVKAAHADTRDRLALAQKVIGAAVGFIDRLVEWGRNGGQGTRPRPPKELHEFLDADDWDLHVTDPDGLRPPA